MSRDTTLKRLMGFEPTTFCMASRRSSQLSYSRMEVILAWGRWFLRLALARPPCAKFSGPQPMASNLSVPGFGGPTGAISRWLGIQLGSSRPHWGRASAGRLERWFV